MAGPREVRAGKATVEVTAEDKFTKAIARMQTRFEAFGRQIRAVGLGFLGAGTGLAAPLAAATRQFEQAGSALNDMSARTGLSVRNLSELAFAAGQTGASIEDVETATKRMSKTLVEAAQGSESAVSALKAIGVVGGELKQ